MLSISLCKLRDILTSILGFMIPFTKTVHFSRVITNFQQLLKSSFISLHPVVVEKGFESLSRLLKTDAGLITNAIIEKKSIVTS